MTKNRSVIDKQLTKLWQNRDTNWEEELKTSQQLWQDSLMIDYRQGMSAAMVLQANCYTGRAQIEKAFNALEKASAIADELENNPWAVRLHFVYGTLFRNFGDYGKALEHYITALNIAEEVDDPDEIARANGNLSIIYIHLKEYTKAIEGLQSVLRNAQANSDPYQLFSVYLNLATANYHIQQSDQAIAMATKALEYADTHRAKLMAHGNIGVSYLIAGKLKKAYYHLKRAYDFSLEVEDPITQSVCGIDLADYYSEAGEDEKAKHLLLQTLNLAQSANYKQGQYDCHQRLYKIYRKQLDWEDALLHHEALHQIDKKMFNESSNQHVRNLEILYRVDALRKTNRRQEQEYQRLTEMKDTLLRDVSHDLKNPLGVIHTTIFLLRKISLDSKDAVSQLNEYCDIILQQSDRMLQLISGVLDMARLEVNSEKKFQLVNMSTLVERICEEFQAQARAKNIQLTFKRSEFVSTVGDESGLKIMVNNLVSNAIKYTENGGTISVDIVPSDNGTFTLQVKDTGIGIPQESISKVFDQSYRVPAHTQIADGTGFGLAIVQRVVETHNGEIEISSKENEGTEFRLKFHRSNDPHGT